MTDSEQEVVTPVCGCRVQNGEKRHTGAFRGRFIAPGLKDETSQLGRRRERAHRPWTVITTGTHRLVVAVDFSPDSSGPTNMTGRPKKAQDPELLEALYWHEGLSMWRIAERLGVSANTIRRRMVEYGIDRRGVGLSPAERDNTIHFFTNTYGYESIHHRHRGGKFSCTVHQLVAIANGANPHDLFANGYVVHHKNQIRWDNRPSNLEVMTNSDHIKHHHEQGDFDFEGSYWYTEEELKSWIQSFVEEFDFVPTPGDINGWPGPSAATYITRFGSWGEAIRAAGFTPRSEQRYEDSGEEGSE